MRRPLSILLVAFATTLVPFAQESSAPTTSEVPSDVARRIQTANKATAAGHPEEALQVLDSLASLNPEPLGVERLRGFAYYQQRNMVAAEAAYAKAVAQDPSDLESMQMQGGDAL